MQNLQATVKKREGKGGERDGKGKGGMEASGMGGEKWRELGTGPVSVSAMPIRPTSAEELL